MALLTNPAARRFTVTRNNAPAYTLRGEGLIVTRSRIQARLQPFETAFAAIIVSQGIVALLGGALFDPATVILPHWQALAFQIAYTIAGLAILVGLVWPRGDLEGAGLVVLGFALLARAVLFGNYLHWNTSSVTSLTFSVFLTGACAMRFWFLKSPVTQVIVDPGGIVEHPDSGDNGKE